MLIGYYKNQIIDLKNKLNKINPTDDNFDLLIDLQLNILKQILNTEKRISSKKNKLKRLKVELHKSRLPKESSNKVKEKITKTNNRIKEYEFLLYVWRCFGDGIAFKYISKWNLKRLMYEVGSPDVKQDSGFLTGKKGIKNELSLLLSAADHGVPALLCDLTNTIRHGDVCLLGAADPHVIEAKSSKNSNKRVERQISAIKKIHDYLESDEGDIGGSPGMKRVEFELDEVHFNDVINETIDRSLHGKSNRKNPENGLYYIVRNLSYSIDYDELFAGIEEPIFFMLNQSKNEQTWGNYYPFTLSLKSPEALYAFLKGDIYIIVVIDGVVLRQYAKNIGYDIEFIMDGTSGFCFLKEIEGIDEPLRVIASDHFFGRISHEFLSMKWFIDSQQQNLSEIEDYFLK